MASIEEKRLKQISRRELLKLAPLVAVGAFAVTRWQSALVGRGVRLSDWASGVLFRGHHPAQTFAAGEVVAFDKFPYNGYDELDPGVDLESWRLAVSGNVQRAGEYTLAQIQSLPRIRQNTRHVCVEGWDVVGRFGGARLADFLALVGADTRSRFVTVECADDYYESLDMATALHPQSLLCYEMYDQPLDRGHGAPLRLSLPTKLGYKSAKYVTNLAVTNVLGGKRGYWEDQGYSWYAGL